LRVGQDLLMAVDPVRSCPSVKAKAEGSPEARYWQRKGQPLEMLR
jgi:hypothetical protein